MGHKYTFIRTSVVMVARTERRAERVFFNGNIVSTLQDEKLWGWMSVMFIQLCECILMPLNCIL